MHTQLYKTISIILTAAIVILAVIFAPVNIPFWAFTTSDIIRLMIALGLAALFIERAVEVILVSWRGKGKQKRVSKVSSERRTTEHEAQAGARVKTPKEITALKKLEKWKAETKVLAMLTTFGLGIIISALGLRALQPIVDPAVFKQLGAGQRALFTGIDTLITGALLGGGSEGIHKILDTFLSKVDKYRQRDKPENQ